MTQQEALSILKTGANVFLTGEPGSGKTHTINTYVSWLRDHGVEPSITASTGIAATHIGGLTIHSWSGIGIKRTLSPYDLDQIASNKRVSERIRHSYILIIDEISMLSAETLSMVDAVCREVKQNDSHFGGLQVILVGDFFQLPPVNKIDADEQMSLGTSPKRSSFAFHSPSWKSLSPIVCYLSEQHRQEDFLFLQFLGAIREGKVDESHKKILRTRYSPKPKNDVTQLYAHNINVNTLNDSELEKIDEPVVTYEMTGRGPAHLIETLKRGCLSPDILRLKKGARVIFTKNDMERRYVNGTRGIVSGFSKETKYPIVETSAGKTIFTEPDEWRIEDGGRTLARISQIPLRLAWALTIHKSQGMSLDAAHMDLSETFEYGQGYVALSRVRTLSGLSIQGLNERALQVHPEISAVDKKFRAISDDAREAFSRIPKDELEAMHSNFIRACGGGVDTVIHSKKAKKTTSRGNTLEVTLQLLKEGKNIKEIAQTRNLKESTIFSHALDLYMKEKLNLSNLKKLASPSLIKSFPRIFKVFQELGSERLTPVFEKLNETYSYDDLRLARIFFEASQEDA